MTTLVIILIIIGVALIILSLFLVEENKFDPEAYTKLLTDRELSFAETGKIRDKVDEIITEVRESHIVKTDDELSQISNEKIIAVNDFSEQVLEKINRNHEEVIFLYNMLNEKQEEIKGLMLEANKIKSKLEEPIQTLNSKNDVVQVSTKKITPTKQTTIVNTQSDHAGENHNQKVLELYSQGFSIVDISKTLEIGQGEVRLVVDLFNQAN